MFRVVGVGMCVMVGLAGVLGCAAEDVQSVEAQEANTAESLDSTSCPSGRRLPRKINANTSATSLSASEPGLSCGIST